MASPLTAQQPRAESRFPGRRIRYETEMIVKKRKVKYGDRGMC
jgi:hypothetical protein